MQCLGLELEFAAALVVMFANYLVHMSKVTHNCFVKKHNHFRKKRYATAFYKKDVKPGCVTLK